MTEKNRALGVGVVGEAVPLLHGPSTAHFTEQETEAQSSVTSSRCPPSWALGYAHHSLPQKKRRVWVFFQSNLYTLQDLRGQTSPCLG